MSVVEVSTFNRISHLFSNWVSKEKVLKITQAKTKNSLLFSIPKILVLKKFLRSLYTKLIHTKTGKILCVVLFFLGYVFYKYYFAYLEIICDKNHLVNFKIIRHIKPRLKKYNPTMYLFHPMLSILLGDLELNSNFIIKFSSQVNIQLFLEQTLHVLNFVIT
jgi:hypothetical protein